VIELNKKIDEEFKEAYIKLKIEMDGTNDISWIKEVLTMNKEEFEKWVREQETKKQIWRCQAPIWDPEIDKIELNKIDELNNLLDELKRLLTNKPVSEQKEIVIDFFNKHKEKSKHFEYFYKSAKFIFKETTLNDFIIQEFIDKSFINPGIIDFYSTIEREFEVPQYTQMQLHTGETWDIDDSVFDASDNKKNSDTFKLVSYPSGENVEDIITEEDGIWISTTCSITGCKREAKRTAKIFDAIVEPDIITGIPTPIFDKNKFYLQSYCKKHFRQIKKCDNFIEEIKGSEQNEN